MNPQSLQIFDFSDPNYLAFGRPAGVDRESYLMEVKQKLADFQTEQFKLDRDDDDPLSIGISEGEIYGSIEYIHQWKSRDPEVFVDGNIDFIKVILVEKKLTILFITSSTNLNDYCDLSMRCGLYYNLFCYMLDQDEIEYRRGTLTIVNTPAIDLSGVIQEDIEIKIKYGKKWYMLPVEAEVRVID